MGEFITKKQALDHIIEKTGKDWDYAGKRLWYVMKKNPSLKRITTGDGERKIITHIDSRFLDMKMEGKAKYRTRRGRPARTVKTANTRCTISEISSNLQDDVRTILNAVSKKKGISLPNLIASIVNNHVTNAIGNVEL